MIYFDNASTTRCSSAVADIVQKYLQEDYFNPSAMYGSGVMIKNHVEQARESILQYLRVDSGNLIFTSSGTESDNLALLGVKKPNSAHIIISATEHSAVYYTAMQLKQKGYSVSICPTDTTGRVDMSRYKELVTKDTALISIMNVNNETGAINDIATLCKIAKEINPKVVFHSDGVQAFGKISVNLSMLGVDMYSISAHKIHGTKGVGALYLKKGLHLSPMLFGGGQEHGLRSSTENTAGIMGFAKAAEIAYNNLENRQNNAKDIRDYLITELMRIDNFLLFSNENHSHFILSLSSDKIRGEVIQHALEIKDILIGTGSACSSNKATKRIPDALSLKNNFKDGIIRLSFGDYNTLDEAKIFAKEFKNTYMELAKYAGY